MYECMGRTWQGRVELGLSPGPHAVHCVGIVAQSLCGNIAVNGVADLEDAFLVFVLNFVVRHGYGVRSATFRAIAFMHRLLELFACKSAPVRSKKNEL